MAKFTLSSLIGTKWRITYDEAWYHEKAEEKIPNKIEYEQVKLSGNGGHLRLHDLKTKTFVIWTKKYKVAYELAEQYPEVRLDKMHNEVDIYIPLKLVDVFLERLKGAKKKVMSEEWKAQASERMRKLHAEGKASGGRPRKSRGLSTETKKSA